MKKLSRIIKESVWADIYDRSTGDTVRQEDIAKTIVIDGVKYFLMKDFWKMGDLYTEENNQDWEAFAFNKMPDGSKYISGDTEVAGVFGSNKYDFEYNYDVYVLKDYLEMTPEKLAQRAIDDFQLYDADYIVQPILEKYVKEVFKSHMSDYAQFWIEALRDSEMDNTMVISVGEGMNYSELDIVKDEFEGKEIEDSRIFLYPDLDGWTENLEKELIEVYEKDGWTKSEMLNSPHYFDGLPSQTKFLCFVTFEEDEDI